MQIAVIIPAAGRGKRFFTGPADGLDGRGKAEVELAGKPLFLHAVELFRQRPEVRQVVLAVPPDRVDTFKTRWGDRLGLQGVVLVPGGTAERWQTVHRALEAVDEGCTHVAIHDAARPLTGAAVIDRVFEAAERFDAVIPAVPVSNTLKRAVPDTDAQRAVDEDDPAAAILGPATAATDPGAGVHRVTGAVDRAGLFEVQTPQVFAAALLRRAYGQLASMTDTDRAAITDDAGLVEALGQTVRIVTGDTTNLKITHPTDMALAEAILAPRKAEAAAMDARKRLFGDDDE